LIRLLLIGPVPYSYRKNTIGGATVLFEEMINFLYKDEQYSTKVISTNRFNNRLISLIYLLIKTIFSLKKTDIIILNVNTFGVKFLWPMFNFISKLSGKKLILRVFGSHFDDDMESKYFTNTLIRIIPKLDLLLLETKHLVSKFQKYNPNTFWLPNVRKSISSIEFADKTNIKLYKKKFIYLGHVNLSKGIGELLSVFKELPVEYELSIYGDIQEKSLSFLKEDSKYKGVINPNEIYSVLRNNDVLILPTFYKGEGYPGVIIEAYREGLPVISTNWKSIPEIVEDGKTGILVSPKNIESLRKAILFFNEANYPQFATNASEAFKNYDSSIVHENLFRNTIPALLK
jgi:glycosyltransferase involved in cell wall biosynthesis